MKKELEFQCDFYPHTGTWGLLERLGDTQSQPTSSVQVLWEEDTRDAFFWKRRRLGSITDRHGEKIGVVQQGYHVTVMCTMIQVTRSEVAYHGGRYSRKGLESAVEKHIYPPAVHCVVVYNSPPDRSRGTKMNKLCIKGTNKEQLSFPFKVYEFEVKSKWLNWAVCECYWM